MSGERADITEGGYCAVRGSEGGEFGNASCTSQYVAHFQDTCIMKVKQGTSNSQNKTKFQVFANYYR